MVMYGIKRILCLTGVTKEGRRHRPELDVRGDVERLQKVGRKRSHQEERMLGESTFRLIDASAREQHNQTWLVAETEQVL